MGSAVTINDEGDRVPISVGYYWAHISWKPDAPWEVVNVVKDHTGKLVACVDGLLQSFAIDTIFDYIPIPEPTDEDIKKYGKHIDK